jgi:hypothetical protein
MRRTRSWGNECFQQLSNGETERSSGGQCQFQEPPWQVRVSTAYRLGTKCRCYKHELSMQH